MSSGTICGYVLDNTSHLGYTVSLKKKTPNTPPTRVAVVESKLFTINNPFLNKCGKWGQYQRMCKSAKVGAVLQQVKPRWNWWSLSWSDRRSWETLGSGHATRQDPDGVPHRHRKRGDHHIRLDIPNTPQYSPAALCKHRAQSGSLTSEGSV